MTVRSRNPPYRCEDRQFGSNEIRVAELALDFSAVAKVRPLRCSAAVALQLVAISSTCDGQLSGLFGSRTILISGDYTIREVLLPQ